MSSTRPIPTSRKGRTRQFVWWGGLCIGLVLLGLLIAVFIFTRSSVLSAIFESSLSDRLGADVHVDQATWAGLSEIELEGVRILAPGLEGPAAEVGSIDVLHAVVDFGALLSGGSPLAVIRVDQARLRIAENLEDSDDVNVGRLFGGSESLLMDEVPALPDRIDLVDLVLEVGAFDGARWQSRMERRFRGSASPRSAADSAYEFLLEEVPASPRAGIRLEGVFDRAAMSLHASVTNIDLEQDMPMLPGVIRTYCEQMDIQGDVRKVTFDVARNEALRFAARLKDVELSIPSELGLDDQWARYENQGISGESYGIPRVLAEEGELVYTDRMFKIAGLHGQFLGDPEDRRASVNFDLDLVITDPAPQSIGFDDDIQSVLMSRLERSAFRLGLRTDEFHLGTGEDDSVRADLPVIVAKILAMFQVRTCDVSINLDASRQPLDNGEFDYVLAGNVAISGASGAYEGFAYPLESLNAQVNFDRETVTVLSLDAKGAGDARISIAGEVVPRGGGSKVDLALLADSLPLDTSLLSAMSDEASHTLESLFGRHGAGAPAPQGDAGSHEVVDLDLRILREFGPDRPTRIEGLIKFEDLALTWDSFPYPITLRQGSLLWKGDTMSLRGPRGEEVVEFITPSGTSCNAQGTIHFPTADQQTSGVLDLEIVGEPVTDDLVAALDELVPDLADLIKSLRVQGLISILGPVRVDSLGNIDYQLIIRLNDGIARPRDHLAGIIGAPEAFWSRGLQLEDVEFELDANQDRVVIRSCAATAGEMRLSMEGTYAMKDPELTSIDVLVEGAPIQERLLRLADGDVRDAFVRLHERWSPAGSLDAQAMIRGRGAGAASIRIDALDVVLHSADRPQRVSIVGGALEFGADRLRLEDLEVDVADGDRPRSQYSLEGELDWADEVTRSDLRCRLVDGRFESPFLMDLATVFAGKPAMRPYLDADPRGAFDAEASVMRAPDADWTWQLEVSPRDVMARYESIPMQAEFDGGLLRVSNGMLRLDAISGRFDGGSFRISGDIDPGPEFAADLRLDFTGRIRSEEIMALLPDEAAEVIDAIDFSDGVETSMHGGRLLLSADDRDGSVTSQFRGAVTLDGASLDAGVDVSSISGGFDMAVDSSPDRPMRFSLEGKFESMQVLGRRIVDSELHLELGESGSVVHLVELSGDLAGGEVHASGQCDLGSARDWQVEVLIADASLSAFVEEMDSGDESEEEPLDGRLYASVSMSGPIDDPSDRLGRGHVQIYDGAMKPLPFTVGLYQLLQLSMPVVEAPEFISIAYHSVGDEIILDRIRIESHIGDVVAFSLTGEGTFDWGENMIDATLRPRSGWALISDVIGALQDQFYAVGVSGPIGDPEVFIIPFPGMQDDDQTAWVPPL